MTTATAGGNTWQGKIDGGLFQIETMKLLLFLPFIFLLQLWIL